MKTMKTIICITRTFLDMPNVQHMTCTLLSFTVVGTGKCYWYPSGLLHWPWGNHDCPRASEVTLKDIGKWIRCIYMYQVYKIMAKQSSIKFCACLIGYTLTSWLYPYPHSSCQHHQWLINHIHTPYLQPENPGVYIFYCWCIMVSQGIYFMFGWKLTVRHDIFMPCHQWTLWHYYGDTSRWLRTFLWLVIKVFYDFYGLSSK